MTSKNDRTTPSGSTFGGTQVPDAVDLQIIGGGLAGLIAANLAVDTGLSVRLLERSRSLGGRAASSDHDGFTVNQGPHALYLNGELNAALQRLGIEAKGAPPELGGATASLGGRVDRLPQGPGSLFKTSLLPASGKRRLAIIMARLQSWDPKPLANLTVDQWLDSLTDVSQLRTLLRGLVNLSTYNSASNMASADAALVQLQMAMGDGVVYLDGGWRTIVNALDRRLDKVAPPGQLDRVVGTATGIEQQGTLQLIHADRGTYRGANVLLAAGSPEMADRLLRDKIGGGVESGDASNLAAAAGPPVQAAVMDLGLSADPERGVHLGLDTRLYYSKHSVADGLAPSGTGLVSIARYLRPGEDHSVEVTKEQLLAHAEAAGVRRGQITMSRYLHRLTVAWGMPLAAGGGLAGRPTPAVGASSGSGKGGSGVYIAGDWVGDRGLLADASAASAGDAVDAVVADTDRRAANLAKTQAKVG